jgi:carboxyl-terminal processing protease
MFFIFIETPSFANTSVDFKVSAKNEQTTKLITRLIEKYHYKKPKLNDEISSDIFDTYLNNLDSNRSYFLASDIEYFENLRYTFDDLLETANLAPAYAMFSIYRRRALDRIGYAKSILETDLNFSINDSYTIERMKEPWALNSEELNKLWDKRVKYDWLGLKLAGESKEEIVNKLFTRYTNIERRIGQIKESDVFELVINTYLSSIEPHTSFFSPRDTENFKIRMSLSLEGIGAVLQTDSEHTLVHRVLPGGPADLGNDLQAGDRITGVGQGDNKELVDVVGWRLDDVVDLIRGPKDSIVRLQILPKTEPMGGKYRIIRIIRDKIRLEDQAASQSIIEIQTKSGKKDIGVITIPTFYVDFDSQTRGEKDYRSTTRDVRLLLNELQTGHIDGIIVDLRGNGGGSLTEAISATGLFIPSGPIVQIRESRGTINIRKDPDPDIVYSGPLAILVDRESASASEIFAGAIQDYRRGIIIGESTFGKGTVQNLVSLEQFAKNVSEEMGQLKITIAQFFRITGDSTQYRGVVPDFFLPETQYRPNQRESTNDNAMRWSQIRPLRYQPFNNFTLDDNNILAITESQNTRIARNPEIQYLTRKAQLDLELAEKLSYSLMNSKREDERNLKEQKINKLKIEFLQNESIKSEELSDSSISNEILLLEAGHILADVIILLETLNQK